MKNISAALDFSKEYNSYKLFQKKDSDKLIIFFSGTDKQNGRFDWYRVGQEVDANVMLVNNGRNEWYQNGIPDLGNSVDESVTSIKTIMEKLNLKEVFTCGVSMGGYGAVLFASKLECNCLAFGFDSLLKIEGSRSLDRMPKDIKLIYPDLVPIIKNSTAFFNIYAGEIDTLDLFGAVRLVDLPNVNVRLLRGVGHGGAPYLENEFGLTNIINTFLNHDMLPRSKYESDLCKNKDGVKHLLYALRYLKKDNIDEAKKHANAAKSLMYHAEVTDYMLGLIYEKEANYRQASNFFSMVVNRVPHFIGAQHKLAVSLRKIGDTAAAIDAYRRFLRLKPNSALGMFWLSKLLYSYSQIKESFELIEQAILIKPENETFYNFYEQVSKHIKKEKEIYKKFVILNEYTLHNIPSGSQQGIVWFLPWKKDKEIDKATHIYISYINKSKKFKGGITQINTGVYEIASLSYNKKRAWYKLIFKNKNKVFEKVIAKDSLSFKLLRKK